MKTVLLRLEGPLQSWGTRSRFKYRDTEQEPSKSGVLGLVAAALGMERDNDAMLAQLSRAQMAVRVDRPGRILVDYHTAGGGTFAGRPHGVFGAGAPVITHREYVSDASFLAALGFDDQALAKQVDDALGSPVWPLYLGRRAHPPSLPVRAGLVAGTPRDALAAAGWPGTTPPAEPVKLVVEAAPGPDTQPREDQPLSFRLHGRHFARRHVRVEWLEPSAFTLLRPEVIPTSLVGLVRVPLPKESPKL